MVGRSERIRALRRRVRARSWSGILRAPPKAPNAKNSTARSVDPATTPTRAAGDGGGERPAQMPAAVHVDGHRGAGLA